MPFDIHRIGPLTLSGEIGTGPWDGVPWSLLTSESGAYRTEFKLGYNDTGFAFTVRCEDRLVSCKPGRRDFDDIYEDDVVELFLWPDIARPLYFEYEISPLGTELALLVPNYNGVFMGWRPWHYEEGRSVRKRVAVKGGIARPGGEISQWEVECCIPFALLKGVIAAPPRAGDRWRGNLFRMDYDSGRCVKWAAAPVTDGQFHNYFEFPEFIFR